MIATLLTPFDTSVKLSTPSLSMAVKRDDHEALAL